MATSPPKPSRLSTSPARTPSPATAIPDSPSPPAETPLPLSASVILSALPAPTSTALAAASESAYADIPPRVTVRLQPVGSAPVLRQRVFKVAREKTFGTVVGFVGRRLGVGASAAKEGDGEGQGVKETEKGQVARGASVFCYVNSVFAPGLDEGIGNLWRCFKTGDELVVAYHVQPAFG